jgi:ABC-type multidrug transport system fused ATPase/permease subunit
MTYGDVTAFTAYAMQLLGPAVRFSQLISQLQQVSIATERLFEIFDEKPEVVNDPDPVVMPIKGQVDFKHVQFYYEEGKPVINDFSIHVEPGQTVALIGPTGCGKSTILNLLLRFYDITGGELLIDGVNIKKLDLHSFRKQFGIVLQESLLFSVSIRENIRFSRPTATDEEIEAAAKVAEIHDFIMTLDKGYDTLVGDFGVELSVGQKQRINIARAICANPAILIMDEATSSLDSDSEQAIQKAMDRVLIGRTSFVVAHRLSTIKNSDQIILLDKGVIQEQGTHDQLMAIPNGRYHDLYTKHMGKGVIEE